MFLETFIPYLAAAVPAFLLGLYIGRNSNTKVGTPSASHNRQITKPASCEECRYDYASIVCSTCGVWLLNKQRQAS